MAQFRPDQAPPTPNPRNPRQPASWLRLAMLAGLSLYIIVLLAPFLAKFGGPARADITYSQLKTEIGMGNIADLIIQEQDAHGAAKTGLTGSDGGSNPPSDVTVPHQLALPDRSLINSLDNQQDKYRFEP